MNPHRIAKANRTPYVLANGQITNENMPESAEAMMNMFKRPILSAKNPSITRPTAFIAHRMASKLDESTWLMPMLAAYSRRVYREKVPSAVRFRMARTGKVEHWAQVAHKRNHCTDQPHVEVHVFKHRPLDRRLTRQAFAVTLGKSVFYQKCSDTAYAQRKEAKDAKRPLYAVLCDQEARLFEREVILSVRKERWQ